MRDLIEHVLFIMDILPFPESPHEDDTFVDDIDDRSSFISQHHANQAGWSREPVQGMVGSEPNWLLLESGCIEPHAETYKDGSGFHVIVDMPGITDDQVIIVPVESAIIVHATSGMKQFRKTIPVHGQVTENDITWRMQNGILDITITPQEVEEANK